MTTGLPRARSSIVANSRGEPRLADLRKVTGSFLGIRYRRGERFAGSQAKAFRAYKPKCLVPSGKTGNVWGAAGVGAELILYPRRSSA